MQWLPDRHAVRYCMETGGEARHHHQQAMTATLIQQESETFFTLTTEKGKEIGVCFHPWGVVGIYIQSTATGGISNGRRFPTLADAIAAYKDADVKAALSALAAA
jgi:putative hemolysin